MTFNYYRANLTATRLISNFGQAATLVKRATPQVGATVADPDPLPSADETSYPVTVVVLDSKNRDREGTEVETRTRTLYIAATGIVPAKADRVLIGGGTLEIAEVRILAPAGINVMFECDVVK